MISIVLPKGHELEDGESDAEFWFPLLEEDENLGQFEIKRGKKPMTDLGNLDKSLKTLESLLVREKKKGIPPLSMKIRKAKTAQEVAERIQSSWLGYGVSDLTPVDGGVQMTITKGGQGGTEVNDDTFKNAMKFLWYKDSGSGTYTLTGSPFPVKAEFGSSDITVTVTDK